MGYTPRIEKLGRLTDTQDTEQQADKMSWAEAKDVTVYVGQFPPGITIENDVVKVMDNSRYEVIARVATNNMEAVPFPLPLAFRKYPEDQAWRNSYCNAQVPLVWLTLMYWSFVPFEYPCWMHESNSIASVNARKNRIINTLKKAAKAVGGNTLVITSLGKLKTFNARTGQELSTLDMIEAEGYALLDKQPGK